MSEFGPPWSPADPDHDEDDKDPVGSTASGPDPRAELPEQPVVISAEPSDRVASSRWIDLDDVDLRSLAPPGDDPVPVPPAEASVNDRDLGAFPAWEGERSAELVALVAELTARDRLDPEPAPLEPAPPANAPAAPGADETSPGTLRPKVPEPVLAARTTTSPSRAHRTVSRLRALLGLVLVVALAGVGLAVAIGAAVLLVVLALGRAFGSG